MIKLTGLVFLYTAMQVYTLFDFKKNVNMKNWAVVDDGVMGGRSAGRLAINEAGNAVFSGSVSLENNGGFSSIRYAFEKLNTADFSAFSIRLKGDGKTYQFRVKSRAGDYYAYITTFTTTGEWQTVQIPFNTCRPSFRGMDLDKPVYNGETMEEIGFLAGNKKAETFRLEIDKIEIK